MLIAKVSLLKKTYYVWQDDSKFYLYGFKKRVPLFTLSVINYKKKVKTFNHTFLFTLLPWAHKSVLDYYGWCCKLEGNSVFAYRFHNEGEDHIYLHFIDSDDCLTIIRDIYLNNKKSDFIPGCDQFINSIKSKHNDLVNYFIFNNQMNDLSLRLLSNIDTHSFYEKDIDISSRDSVL